MKNLKNHYHYIKVDANNILPQYQVMLVCDSSSAENDADKRIEMFNSIYPIMMLKDNNSDKIVGILKPEDTETYTFGDKHNLITILYSTDTNEK